MFRKVYAVVLIGTALLGGGYVVGTLVDDVTAHYQNFKVSGHGAVVYAWLALGIFLTFVYYLIKVIVVSWFYAIFEFGVGLISYSDKGDGEPSLWGV